MYSTFSLSTYVCKSLSKLQVKGSAIVSSPVTLTPETLSVAEDGGTGMYTVVLATEPTNDVTVTVTAGTGVTVNTDGGTAGAT
ncbi:MAG: hypothetical protein F4025_07510 [Synechococcus sp. SB0669_bin_7]|nr:hypothetical protein [Cyanobacteria bacterium MAG IRC3_bin_20]MYG65056.1 hypothetical protein [Synechococcus sp. SB0675_bin_7]MYK06376.1 hypothetical protein [Synechococcus sp. SB0670_bin_20]MYK86230.1 hypothetical protein [Synechococcus sp. SB0669_bin_7]